MMKFEFLLWAEYNGYNGCHGRHAEGSKVAQCPYQKQVSHTFLCHVTSHGWIKPNDAGIWKWFFNGKLHNMSWGIIQV